MHNVQPKKRDKYKKVGKLVHNRLSPQLVEASRLCRSNVLNPDKRRRARINEKVALRREE